MQQRWGGGKDCLKGPRDHARFHDGHALAGGAKFATMCKSGRHYEPNRSNIPINWERQLMWCVYPESSYAFQP